MIINNKYNNLCCYHNIIVTGYHNNHNHSMESIDKCIRIMDINNMDILNHNHILINLTSIILSSTEEYLCHRIGPKHLGTY